MHGRRVGVVMGGSGAARELSLRAGREVARALAERGHEVSRIVLERGDDVLGLLLRAGIDVALLALRGRRGEDGCVQSALELLSIPYTGSSPLASALAMDKIKAKELFRLYNVATPPYYAVTADEAVGDLVDRHGSFGFPVVVKPRSGALRVGVARVNGPEGLEPALRRALEHDEVALVERYVAGDEVHVALLGGRVLGAVEVSGPESAGAPRRLEPSRLRSAIRLAERAAQALGSTGAVGVDVLVTPGENEYVTEVDALPWLHPTGPVARIAAGAGYDFGALCEAILAGARLHLAPPRQAASPASDRHAGDGAPRRLAAVAGR